MPIKWTLANGVDPDRTPKNGAYDQSLHCIHLGQEFSIKHGNNTNQPDTLYIEMNVSKELR